MYLTDVRRLPAERALRLRWDDDHEADFPFAHLRGWCPCAMCQGHGALRMTYHPPAGPVDVVAIHPVGNYAISLSFSDGHSTGIYRFEFLREICPCPSCRT
jgi:DUF971 family protein